MNLLRWGKFKSREDATALVEEGDPKVIVENDLILVRVTGREGQPTPGTTYEYRLELSTEELATIVENAIEQGAVPALTPPLAKAIGNLLREALRKPE